MILVLSSKVIFNSVTCEIEQKTHQPGNSAEILPLTLCVVKEDRLFEIGKKILLGTIQQHLGTRPIYPKLRPWLTPVITEAHDSKSLPAP